MGISLAQLPKSAQNTIGSSSIKDTLNSGVMPLDTPVVMSYVLIDNPDIVYTLRDTFTWSDVQHDPLKFYQGFLGNLGSAARSLTPLMDSNFGFSTGWDQFDPYFFSSDNFKFFDQKIPVAKVKYSQANKDNTYISLDFGRSFAKGLNLSVSYDRINQIGEFAHQHQKNTSFGIGVWDNAPSGRYDAFYNFLSNAAVGEDNGGIDSIDLIGEPLYPDSKIPVNILGGLTTNKHRSFSTKQIFHLIPDSSDIKVDLWFNAGFSSGLYKYVDENPSTPDYYGAEYLIDQRGLRQFTFERQRDLSAGISMPWHAAGSMIQTSLSYRSILLQQEPDEKRINELFWNASGDFQWIKAVQLNGQMSIGLGQVSGLFSFRVDGSVNTGILGKLSGYWSIVKREPYMIESSLFVNQQLIYKSHFDNPVTNDIGVVWEWKDQKLSAGLNWMVFDNFIYFDSNRQPAQINSAFSLRRLSLHKEFDLRWIGLNGNIIWQPDAKAELAIPDIIYNVSLYGRIKIFDKKVTFMPGLEITYHDGFSGLSYFPVTGKYYLTNGLSIPDYLRVDAGLGLKIRFLKIFARMEDIAGLWDSKRVIYQAEFYPHYSGYFRLGVAAGFFN